ncbi:MAG: MATE family efflux transporter [Oscillospiraceae bacterium]|nr:MATE family efflux transporter [Oscillospiraceae bacterium]
MMSLDQAERYRKMTETPVGPLILSLAGPTIVSMLITAVYNTADTFFVSQLGTSATGAVGVVFSLMAIIQAVGFTLGMGTGSRISRLMGQRKQEEAEQVLASGFVAALAFGLCLTVFGLLFLDPLMNLLGSTPTILPYARDYGRYILLGAAVMGASFVLNNALRAEGQAVLSMVGITVGGVLNIALDPLFIFGLRLEIAGAAIATLLSQCVSFGILLSCYLRGKSVLRLRLGSASRKPLEYWMTVQTGFPSFCRQGLASVATVALNKAAAVYGDPAVAAMSVVGRVFMLILSVILGFGQGFQPVAGFNYGAKKYRRVRDAAVFTLTVGTGIMAAMAVAGCFAAPRVIRLFGSDPDFLEIGIFAMRAQCLGMILQPMTVVSNMTFQSIGRSWQATLLSSARQGIYFLPLILILPWKFGLLGVQCTQPLADLLTSLTCIPFLALFFRELNELENTRLSKNSTA